MVWPVAHSVVENVFKTWENYREAKLKRQRLETKSSDLKSGHEVENPRDLWLGNPELVPTIINFRGYGPSYDHIANKFMRMGTLADTNVMGLDHLPAGFQLIVIPPDTPLKP